MESISEVTGVKEKLNFSSKDFISWKKNAKKINILFCLTYFWKVYVANKQTSANGKGIGLFLLSTSSVFSKCWHRNRISDESSLNFWFLCEYYCFCVKWKVRTVIKKGGKVIIRLRRTHIWLEEVNPIMAKVSSVEV